MEEGREKGRKGGREEGRKAGIYEGGRKSWGGCLTSEDAGSRSEIRYMKVTLG
jgi:hypothetical protein